jgi:hypothetical protein
MQNGINYEGKKIVVFTKNKMSTDRESVRGNKRARATRGSTMKVIKFYLIFLVEVFLKRGRVLPF